MGVVKEANSKRYPAIVGANDWTNCLVKLLMPSIAPTWDGSAVSVAKDCLTGIANSKRSLYATKSAAAV